MTWISARTGGNEVIQYVTEKYGRDKVCQIITFGTMAARGVLRDVGRALDMSYGDVDRIAKLVPEVLGITLNKALEQEPSSRSWLPLMPRSTNCLKSRSVLRGLPGTPPPMPPVWWSPQPCWKSSARSTRIRKPALINTQYSMKYVEKIGLVKFDFLGLKNLTVIDNAVKLIRVGKDPEFDISLLGDDDALSYQLISDGNTTGVFQLESSGMKGDASSI